MTYYISNDYLAHHGVKGMHWGIRKQNRYDKKIAKLEARKKSEVDSYNAIKSDLKFSHGPLKGKTTYSVKDAKRDQKIVADVYDKRINKLKEKRDKLKEKRDKSGSSSNTKKYIAIGAGLAAAGLATYGAVKYSKYIKSTAAEHAYEKGKKIADRFYDLEYKHGTTAADFYSKARDAVSSRKAREYQSTAEYYVKRAYDNGLNGNIAIDNALSKFGALKTGSTRDAYKYLRENGYNILGRKKKL